MFRRLVLYGKCHPSHPDWPYVLIVFGGVLALLGLLLALTGCMASGTKVTEEEVFAFEPGRTSCFDIIAKHGKPTWSELREDRTRTLQYTYTQSQLKAINFIPIAAMFAQGSTSETTTVTFVCDARGMLVSSSASQGQTTLGTGLSSGAKQ